MNIIAADVGGTKARLVFASGPTRADIEAEHRLECGAFENFNDLLDTFLARVGVDPGAVDIICLALPGPVQSDVVSLTNLPWVLDKEAMGRHFGGGAVHFINDFQAAALGVNLLDDTDMVKLVPGAHNSGAVRVVVGAGTGLGLAWLLDAGGQQQPFATEGGHVDYAPVDARQIELLQHLMQRYGHVSCERILSGPGLASVYAFCAGVPDGKVDAAGVQRAADAGEAEAVEAMRLFVSVYGSYVGNLALLFKPDAGIYIVGGVAAKIVPWMRADDFVDAYTAKGRMAGLVQEFSVDLVTNERVGALGALAYAASSQQAKPQ